jgi:hypothetical protein
MMTTDLQVQQAALKSGQPRRRDAAAVHRDRAVGRQRRRGQPGRARPDFRAQPSRGDLLSLREDAGVDLIEVAPEFDVVIETNPRGAVRTPRSRST